MTVSAEVDYRAAWEAAALVVVAAGRFIEAEREGNRDLIEDAHFGLLRALAEYRAGTSWVDRRLAAESEETT